MVGASRSRLLRGATEAAHAAFAGTAGVGPFVWLAGFLSKSCGLVRMSLSGSFG